MDLSTSYLGLALPNPLVASASPLSNTLDGVRRLADAGVGAVVLYSLFEEQVRQEAERQLQEAALADGILRTAQQNAVSTITSLLQGLGFEKIEFE